MKTSWSWAYICKHRSDPEEWCEEKKAKLEARTGTVWSWHRHGALVTFIPHPIETLIREQPKAALPEGKERPVSVTETPYGLRGISASYLVEWEDGTRGIFKPGAGDQPARRRAFASADNEVAAFRLARLLGYGAVPETDYVSYEVKGRTLSGSVQRWVENARLGRNVPSKRKKLPGMVAQRTEMALFDELIGNYDRHGGNYLEDKSGFLWAIDHGLAFRDIENHSQDHVDLKWAHQQGVFDDRRRSAVRLGWRKVPRVQVKGMADILARWSTVPCSEIERAMSGCGKGAIHERIHGRIRTMRSAMGQVLESLEV